MLNIGAVCVPADWCSPLNHKSSDWTELKKGIVEWCVSTGIASKDVAEKTVVQLNPFQYMNMLFPKVDPSHHTSAELYKINASLIVAGYIMDDVLETYSLEALEELDMFFRSTEEWVSKLTPVDYPNLEKLSESLSKIEVTYSRAVICMFIDNYNKYSMEIWSNYKVSLSNVSKFRRRLSASVTAYLEMAMRKRRENENIDEKEFLWRRSADNLGFPVLMLSEVLSNVLDKDGENIPSITLHYFHMYSNLFAHVLNDLNSYHRDVETDHNSLVKLWMKDGIAADFDDAVTKIVQFLNSIIIRIHRAFQETQKRFPNCSPLQTFLRNTAHTFTGWILVHTTAVERYKLSPYQTALAKVGASRLNEWLESESDFGKRCVQLFDELMQEREEEMVAIYGMDGCI